jgi:hypothetical protein
VAFDRQQSLKRSQSCTLKVQHEGFPVKDLKNHPQKMAFIHFLLVLLLESRFIVKVGGCVDQLDILEPLRRDYAVAGLDLEDLAFKDGLLECVLFAWLAWISPWLQINLVVARQLELPLEFSASDVLDGDDDLARFYSRL